MLRILRRQGKMNHDVQDIGRRPGIPLTYTLASVTPPFYSRRHLCARWRSHETFRRVVRYGARAHGAFGALP